MTPWESYSQLKIIPPEKIEELSFSLRKENKKIATLNGSFDLLHAGHMHILFEAKKTADILIVAVNSDLSVKRYKAQNRPIVSLEFRMQMLTALFCVDYVTWFHEIDPIDFIKKVKPDIHVNGAEYGENCIEAETVREIGGKLHLVSRIDGLATSQIIEKIQKLGI